MAVDNVPLSAIVHIITPFGCSSVQCSLACVRLWHYSGYFLACRRNGGFVLLLLNKHRTDCIVDDSEWLSKFKIPD